MTKYLLKRNLLVKPETAEFQEAGTEIELDPNDDRTKDLLERGTIVETGEGVTHTPTPTAFEQAQAATQQEQEQTAQVHAETAQKQAEAQSDIEARRAEILARGEQPQSSEEAPAATTEGDQAKTVDQAPGETVLTPEQVAQDFQKAGVETSPTVPPQQ